MRIWTLNNTKFDKYKEWESYFYNEYIPFLERNSRENDIIVHFGKIFNNSELILTKNINKSIELFTIIAKIKPLFFLDGYDSELLKLLSYIDNITIVNEPKIIDNVKLIPKKYNIVKEIDSSKIFFINSQIEQTLLNTYDKVFYCGFYDIHKKNNNITNIGSLYQLNNESSAGFYVIDSITGKNKYIKNKTSEIYEIIQITDIKQIDELDKDYINKNNISIEIDKLLVVDQTIKIDVLLNDFNFKSISYINNSEEIEMIDNQSLQMKDLILEKIKQSNNENLLPEFENIMKIYKERY